LRRGLFTVPAGLVFYQGFRVKSDGLALFLRTSHRVTILPACALELRVLLAVVPGLVLPDDT
jgi:hypothetical protein